MLKKLSLRARLTCLSALVTAGAAVLLTAVSLYSADHIFVRELPRELTFYTISASDDLARPVTAAPDFHYAEETPPAEIEIFSAAAPQAEISEVFQVTLARAGRQFNLWGIAGLLLVTLLGAGATWLMAGRALAPVRELSAAIGEIGGSDLSRRVDLHGRQDEIGRLAESFNAMMDQVSASFDRQKRFSASAAHELKTPLATIRVGLEVLELDERPSPERMEKALAVARTNTDRMIRLVDDLFRLSSDGDCGPCEMISVRDLFCEILAELSPQIKAKRLAVSANAAPGCRLAGGRTMLCRALFNLAENAVKYNREGGSLSLGSDIEDGAVVIRVSDSGVGIPGEELERIFEPFYRIERSRSRAVGGAGLGLSLVRDIVEKHGGSIGVTSAPGEGTVFTLRFPRPQTDD